MALAALLLGLPAAVAVADPPTVNGLFYGDGDNTRYIVYDTSYYGSVLYTYYDAPTTTLYVAFVVNPDLNDNVFTDRPPDTTAYMTSVGWGAGGGQQRDATVLTNSEFAQFIFECAGAPNSWSWYQAYGCAPSPSTGLWRSAHNCGPGTGTPPPSYVSSSSFVWNINNYRTKYGTTAPPSGSPPWNMYVYGAATGNWKSPFASSAPTTVPADYYANYSTTYEWEWRMVWEWSVNLTTAGCGTNALYLVSGLSHHSPMKAGVVKNPNCEDEGDDPENDCFPPDPDPDPFTDFGDLPDSYRTMLSSDGARHYMTTTGPYLGQTVEIEVDSKLQVGSVDATDDGVEEDGITLNVTSSWTAGSSQTIQAVVARGPAVLAAWFDWNNDGDFADPGEFFSWNVATGSNTLPITVGSAYNWQTHGLYARFRIFSSAAAAPGGTLDAGDYLGAATDGEVEDYYYPPGTLPVTVNAFASERGPGGEMRVSWQTASETDNVGFEVWGLANGTWMALSELVPATGMDSHLPQSYEVSFPAPEGVAKLQLVNYDSRGLPERFGPYAVGSRHGEEQPPQLIDWREPRREHEASLRARGFRPVASGIAGGSRAVADSKDAPAAWKRVRGEAPVRGEQAAGHGVPIPVAGAAGAAFAAGRPTRDDGLLNTGPLTHVAVTATGIQRVTYEALLAGGLDLARVQAREIAVTWRGDPVARWIDGPPIFGPGSAIVFIGRAPEGDDALYIGANLYQVAIDKARAVEAGFLGRGKALQVSPSYSSEVWVNQPKMYLSQSPTGDPWIERGVTARKGKPVTVTLDLPVDAPVIDGASQLLLGLGSLTDLVDIVGPGGTVLPEHNVEVWFAGPGSGFIPVGAASTSGKQNWRLDVDLPRGLLKPGLNKVQLRFSTEYLASLVAIDRYGVRFLTSYAGPTLDFPADVNAKGYRIDGFSAEGIVALAERGDGSLTRIEPVVSKSGAGFAAELRPLDASGQPRVRPAHYWVSERPIEPEVFTTQAPPDLLAGPADLVVIAGSAFVGSPALEEYLRQRSELRPVVIDVEDIYNATGFGMAVPSAITAYLKLRDAVFPFTHVQLVGTDCYDRLNYVSQCLSFVPLPTAPVGVTLFSPSQNRLVDLDGDGLGDKAVGQFSVRSEAELAAIVGKGGSWLASGLGGSQTALFVAEEPDGEHDFRAQVGRLERELGWGSAEVLDMSHHPSIVTAREAFRLALDRGQTITTFSGHSSSTMWAYRGLITAASAATLTNVDTPTLMLPLACQTTYDISPNANVLGHQLLFAGEQGAVAISGAVSLASINDNEQMARVVFAGLKQGLTLGEAVLQGRKALGPSYQSLHDNWVTQGDAALRLQR